MAKIDNLVKPDMSAVLSRTHISRNVHGFLLPVLEAISNGMDAIESRFGEDARLKGLIEIRFVSPNEPAKLLISVTDNGVGLNDANYRSFKTPFSGYKLDQNGRGFGRFIAFKVFSRILYSSRYKQERTTDVRTFRFDIKKKEEFIYFDGRPDFSGVGLRVEFDEPHIEWHDLVRSLHDTDVLDQIGSHFLPYFLYRWLPKITIQFDDKPAENITSHFADVFVEYDKGEFQCEIDGESETIQYSLSRVRRSGAFKSHCLLFAAAHRIVGFPRELTHKLGEPFFIDEENQKYIVIAVVRSDAFEQRLNDARTTISLPSKVVEEIVASVAEAIQGKETTQIEKIKSTQSTELGGALRENPILRLGLRGRTVSAYVGSKPNNWKAEDFISDLAIERYRATNDFSKQMVAAGKSPEDYEQKLHDLVKKLDAGKKESLAEYVIHRKNIIELIEIARKFREDGKRAPEEDIHELVFRRFSDSVKTGYFEHNLWLIDDALAFLPYVSSDRAMHGKGRKAGDKVADLLFFDDGLILGDGDGTTISLIEFKKPSRNDYVFGDVKSDPVLQILETIDKAVTAGGITKTDGAHITFTGVVRRFGFIVADITPSLVKVLKGHDFKNDWNPKIYVRYRDNEQIFIQAFGYETLVELAKKRNQAFFSVLLDE